MRHDFEGEYFTNVQSPTRIPAPPGESTEPSFRDQSIPCATSYSLEAAGDETVVRRHDRRTIRDVRSLGEVMFVFGKSGLYRIRRGWAVNPRRIREIRLQRDGRERTR